MEPGRDNTDMVGWTAGCGESYLSGAGSGGRNSTAARQHGRRPSTPSLAQEVYGQSTDLLRGNGERLLVVTIHLVAVALRNHHQTQSGTGMLPSAMPAASISRSL